MKLQIVMLGSGNVATQLSRALVNAGHSIKQVYSRHINSARELALDYHAKAIDDFSLLDQHSDLYIIAIADTAIKEVLSKTNFSKKRVVHTAGSVPIDVFTNNIEHFGVFYPFQTFSKKKRIDFSDIPFCIEANRPEFEIFLFDLAKQLSSKVQLMNSEKRKTVHLSGVFANNFVNHLYYIAGDILSKNNIEADIIKPLIKETAHKIKDLSPSLAQTGPARRNDVESIKKHLDLLSSSPEYNELYKLITKDIIKKYHD